ncbi:hypothetical protein B0H17DRAFT_1210181 [Mycena rosella]|uniref:F-box domain-containing protein n=1 Tax=Mycena rosella TaxID=1033263 RepID=A0AAD7CX01_MYCRO|nr:hypothetical protein B0H17DRAFT_1210181 [Mycena rosella]
MACLPQELVDAIIDRIPDKTSLKQCALVAPSFLAPSQRRIFRSLSVYRGQSQRRPNLAAASALLTASPHIASYVRNLLVELPNFILESPSLETVLRALRNLERLVVSGKSVAWNNLEPGARSALFHSVALPSLVRLHLVNVRDVPWALIVAATSIPVLSFYAILMDQREDPHPLIQHHESSSSPRLRHLILNDAGPSTPPICDFLLQSMTPPHTSRIERLEIRIVPFSGGYDQRLLAACASTLQYLVIDPGALIQSINIPHMPLVRGVEINIFIDRNRRLPALFPSTLSQLASSMPLLETITLAFVVEPTHPEAAWSDAGPLPILGLSFKDRMELLHLRAVHCKLLQRNTFGTPEGPDTLFSRFVDAMESRMPGLQDTGILTCTLTEPQPRYVDRLP